MMDEYFLDIPRVLARGALKKAGLPASIEVGIPASVVKEVRAQIEFDSNITVVDAVLATTHLVAIYEDGIVDICEIAGFTHITPEGAYEPMVFDTGYAYGGYGFGWCEHWQDDALCQNETVELPSRTVLGVHYSRTALVSTLADIQTPVGSREGYGKRIEDFTLGSDAKGRYGKEEDYWVDVKRTILLRMLETPYLTKADMVLSTGDMVEDADFRRVLEGGLREHLGWLPPIYDDDALVVSAKGAAELRRRGKAPWGK